MGSRMQPRPRSGPSARHASAPPRPALSVLLSRPARWAPTLLLALSPWLAGCGGSSDGDPTEPGAEATPDPGIAALESEFPVPPLGPPEWEGFGVLSDIRVSLQEREQRALELYRSTPTAELAIELGRLYTRAEELARGMGFLLLARAQDPDGPEPWLWMAINRLSAHDYERAIEFFSQAEERGVEDARLHRFRGETWERLGNSERAREAYARAVERGPSFGAGEPEDEVDARNAYGEALLALAKLEEERGAYAAARDLLKRHLDEIQALHPEALFRLARNLSELGDEEGAQAVRAQHERAALMDDLSLLTEDLSNAQRCVSLGIHYLGEEQAAQARAEFERALEIGSDPQTHAMALVGVSDSLLRLQLMDEARTRIAELERFQPNHPLLPELQRLAAP